MSFRMMCIAMAVIGFFLIALGSSMQEIAYQKCLAENKEPDLEKAQALCTLQHKR